MLETKFSPDSAKTVTGVPLLEIADRLAVPFEPAAYKPVPGGAELTDISTGYMLQRVTEVFGLKGIGWGLKFSPEDMIIEKDGSGKTVTAHLRYARFWYTLIDSNGMPSVFEVETSGVSSNQMKYAPEGARTSALGAALKGMCFQLEIYKNATHQDGSPKRPPAQRVARPPAQRPQGAPESQEAPPDPVREYLTGKKRLVMDELGETSEDAYILIKQLMKENDLTAESAFANSDKFNEIVAACISDLKGGAKRAEQGQDS